MEIQREIDADAIGRYTRWSKRPNTKRKYRQSGTEIQVKGIDATNNTSALREEISSEIKDFRTLRTHLITKWMTDNSDGQDGLAKKMENQIIEKFEDVKELRYVAIPKVWGNGLRVFVEGGVPPNQYDMARYFSTVATRSRECITAPEGGLTKPQVKELWNRLCEHRRKRKLKLPVCR